MEAGVTLLIPIQVERPLGFQIRPGKFTTPMRVAFEWCDWTNRTTRLNCRRNRLKEVERFYLPVVDLAPIEFPKASTSPNRRLRNG